MSMTKKQSIPIVIVLLWFSHTFTLYTTLFWVEFNSQLTRLIAKAEFLPIWLYSIVSIVLSNFEQYSSMIITGFMIGLIFGNYKNLTFITNLIYIAYIAPSVFIAAEIFNQLQINKVVFYSGKFFIFLINYLLIYSMMKFAQKFLVKGVRKKLGSNLDS